MLFRSPTIVLYMARAMADEIAARLMAAGRPPHEPAAIVANASFAHQSVTITTLAALGAEAAKADTPAIIVIGQNVRLAEGLDWLGAMAGRVLDPDPTKARRLIDGLKIYPYSQRDNPAPTRHIAPAGRPWSGEQPRGLAYWEGLRRKRQK